MGELSLVLFTVFSQLAVGALVALWLIETLGKSIRVESGKFISASIVGIAGVSIIISLFHLGHPAMAPMAIMNLGSSWLSREIAMFTLFLIVSLIYMLQWKENGHQSRKVTGCIAAIIGTVAVATSGMIYVLPAMPAWNNFSPVIFFLATALILGPVFVVGLLAWKKEIELPNVTAIALVAITVSIVSTLLYLSTIYSGSVAQSMTAANMVDSAIFWARVLVGWVVPLAIFAHYAYHKQKMSESMIITAFVLLLVGELMARELFYSTVVGLQIGL